MGLQMAPSWSHAYALGPKVGIVDIRGAIGKCFFPDCSHHEVDRIWDMYGIYEGSFKDCGLSTARSLYIYVYIYICTINISGFFERSYSTPGCL